jgi:hypothetical protein
MPTIAAATASVAAPLTPVLEEGRERQSSRGSTRERHRAGEDTHERVLAETDCDRSSEHVLKERHDGRNQQKEENEEPASP